MSTDHTNSHDLEREPNLRKTWNWSPQVPIDLAPIIEWPPRPLAAIRFLLGRGYVYSTAAIFILLAILTWFYLLPPVETWATFSVGWVLRVALINLSFLLLYAGGLHLYFHVLKKQGHSHRFEQKELDRHNRKFLFNNQVHDNIFFCCVSGIPISTAWQVLVMWGYANGYTPWLAWEDHPVLFALMFVLIALLNSMHFYCIHRLLHWPPLFRLCHSVHHRNINIGPWSGISMHPIEHVLYFSVYAIHFVLLTHPVHLFYHVYFQTLSPASSHSGYADLQIRNKSVFALGDFFHQLHHRYFDCNYGTSFMAWDRWFGTFHDGTEEATTKLREYQLRRREVR